MMGEKGVSPIVVIAVLAIIIIAASVYLFMKPPEAPPADVVVWHSLLSGEKKVAEEGIATSFKQKYPDITIDFLEIMDLRTRLLAAIPAGKGPDVFMWAHDWTGEFADAGHIYPLTEFVTPELMEKFTSTAVEACTYDDKIWALPYAAETVALIYNKAMVEDPPETMEELIAAMAKAKAEGMYGIAYPIDPYFVSAWVHAFGGWYWSDENRTVGANSEGTIRGLRYLIETFKPYMAADPTGTVQIGVFLEKMSPFCITGPWAIPSIKDAGIDYGVVPLPKITELDRWPEPFTGVKVTWMTSAAKNKENAFAFIEWFATDPDHILARAEEARFIPVLKETLELEEIKADPFISGFAEAVTLGRPMPKGPEMMLTWGPFGDSLMLAWIEPGKLQQYFDDAQSRIEAKIAEVYG